MNDKQLQGDFEINVGVCYAVSIKGRPAFARVKERITPNTQGVSGPTRWIGERVGEADEPENEGRQVELKREHFIRKAKRLDMCIRAIRMGWESDKDIHEYLLSCGVAINISTVGTYKSQYRNNAVPKRKIQRSRIDSFHFAESLTPEVLTQEIFRLAKATGGLKALGEIVASLQQVVECAHS